IGSLVRADVANVLRDGAPNVSVSFHEIRPGEVSQLLRERVVDLALARVAPAGGEVDSAALRPTPALLVVPAAHRFAGRAAVRLADLDGERLLTWSPVGTPYTDLILGRLAAAGAAVCPVESHVTGSSELPELTTANAVAVVPQDWPVAVDHVVVPFAEPVDLPLLVLWPAGTLTAAVRRVRAGMAMPA
ncbi:MAG TPA: LysR substrate-binding domain-containing protein, partial [Solirubrobacteraceae bacterium]|nr:LysR substrate-binding domain-containing protein [Solirubrobacteraceae bacterium]